MTFIQIFPSVQHLRLFPIFSYFFYFCSFSIMFILTKTQHFDLFPNRTSPTVNYQMWMFHGETHSTYSGNSGSLAIWYVCFLPCILFSRQLSFLQTVSKCLPWSSEFGVFISADFLIKAKNSAVSRTNYLETAIHGASIFTEICPLKVSPMDLSKYYTIHNYFLEINS